ncbi:30S ribosomal protein S17 [Candidatus Peribacteria bacterium RIFCSPHIGHO2_01_FULL_51_9]|nr:MAG: 30S ribosomal protein S17 [Candidatus Peribacteria bacterium RIFCSPHIGHO2_01_FULL_51_9]
MRQKKGIVTSAKMTGTVTVTVHRESFHPLYKKPYRVSTKFLVDLHGQDAHVGDLVRIEECRPLSKRKYFRVAEILKHAAQVSELKEEKGVEDLAHKKKDTESSHHSSLTTHRV